MPTNIPALTEHTGTLADDDVFVMIDTSAANDPKDRKIQASHLRYQLVRAVTSASDPTVNDDSADGFTAGNFWLNTTDDGLFVCTDNTAGAAVWTEFGTGTLASDPVSINTQSGTTYTLVLGDAGKLVTCENAAAITLTIPTNASVAFATGTVIAVAQLGAGTLTVEGDTGVTVNGTSGGSEALSAQYGTATLTKLGSDTWLVSGSLA